MREQLRLLNNKTKWFIAWVKPDTRVVRGRECQLIVNVRLDRGEQVANHLWLPISEIGALPPNTLIKFRGKVEGYIKGYFGPKGRAKGGYEKKWESDYQIVPIEYHKLAIRTA